MYMLLKQINFLVFHKRIVIKSHFYSFIIKTFKIFGLNRSFLNFFSRNIKKNLIIIIKVLFCNIAAITENCRDIVAYFLIPSFRKPEQSEITFFAF